MLTQQTSVQKKIMVEQEVNITTIYEFEVLYSRFIQ